MRANPAGLRVPEPLHEPEFVGRIPLRITQDQFLGFSANSVPVDDLNDGFAGLDFVSRSHKRNSRV